MLSRQQKTLLLSCFILPLQNSTKKLGRQQRRLVLPTGIEIRSKILSEPSVPSASVYLEPNRPSSVLLRSACVPVTVKGHCTILSSCPLHTNSECRKIEAHINWPMVTCKGSTRYWNYLEDYWPCAGGVSAVNACPCSRLRIWSRESGSAVPSRVSLLIISILRLNLVLTYGILPEFLGGVHLFI